jgi:ubiquinone biosynthesis protein UbiJ
VAAYRAGQFLRGALDFGRRGFESLFADGSRLMQKQGGDLVSAEESREWMDAVDSLRSSADRIEARIQRITQRLQAKGETS